MTLTTSKTPIIYPETDGKPMTESDIAREYIVYAIDILQNHFCQQDNVYVSGNLFIYYEEGVSE